MLAWIAALRARILVWSAMSSIRLTISRTHRYETVLLMPKMLNTSNEIQADLIP